MIGLPSQIRVKGVGRQQQGLPKACSITSIVKHINKRPAYLPRRSLCHSPVSMLHRRRRYYRRCTGGNTQYYRSNRLRANPDKTQVTAFHLQKINKWSNTELENTDQAKYLGATLDRTLSYKQHIHNPLWKLASMIRTTALALCYSVAEYAAPAWQRSHHANVLDSELNTACRAIT